MRVGAARFAAGTNGRWLADAGHRAGLREPAERAAATRSSPVRLPAGMSPAIAQTPQTASPGPCSDLRKGQQCPPYSWFEPTPAQCNSLSVGSTGLGQVRFLWPSVLSVGIGCLRDFRGAATPALRFNSAGGTAAVSGCGDTPNWLASSCEKGAAGKNSCCPKRILLARRASNQLLHKTRPIRSLRPVQKGEQCHCERRAWPGKHARNFLKHLSRNGV